MLSCFFYSQPQQFSCVLKSCTTESISALSLEINYFIQKGMDVNCHSNYDGIILETTKINQIKLLLAPIVIDKVLRCDVEDNGDLRFYCFNKASCMAATTLPATIFSKINTRAIAQSNFSTYAKAFVVL